MSEENKIINHNVSSESTFNDEIEIISKKDITNKFQIMTIVAAGILAAVTSLIFHYYFKLF